jgi:hypothetical protein
MSALQRVLLLKASIDSQVAANVLVEFFSSYFESQGKKAFGISKI